MKMLNNQELYMMLLSMYFNTADGETEGLHNAELLEELIEVVNESAPGLSPDQYLS